MFETIQSRAGGRYKHILEPIIELAVEIAREGREGRRIGTLFTVGDAEAVLQHSRSLILDHWPATPKPFAILRTRTCAGRSRSWRNSTARS